MEKHPHIPLSFDEISAFHQADSLVYEEARKQAMIQYHHQHSGHADAIILANTSFNIPLGESILTSRPGTPSGALNIHLAQPPVNAACENHILSACKPDGPGANQRLRENTQRLVDSGIVEKLGTNQALDASPFEVDETSGMSEDDADTNRKRTQEAHARYWEAMGGIDQVIGKRPHKK
ncbi:uncharacterized protein N7518_003802 [Penicillium psychrosexuale]|uniref:uncharacterized protein n=1 Tax=Penicillium psychrosexuale TaxID=1002107 RepID=UPI002544EEB5|nr:uncharacterized protein N7518_003802 [Penicillium psychrosexuale]KAJ5801734.1 hypothetical protein N7518_003802 [Penicillium psychrosexuale]